MFYLRLNLHKFFPASNHFKTKLSDVGQIPNFYDLWYNRSAAENTSINEEAYPLHLANGEGAVQTSDFKSDPDYHAQRFNYSERNAWSAEGVSILVSLYNDG